MLGGERVDCSTAILVVNDDINSLIEAHGSRASRHKDRSTGDAFMRAVVRGMS